MYVQMKLSRGVAQAHGDSFFECLDFEVNARIET